MSSADESQATDAAPGALVLVVGPSGAGKDTLIGFGRDHLADDPRFHFVRRVVTRQADATLEDHDSLDEAGFARAAEAGDFALHWRAHGLAYGIPAAVDGVIAAGGVVIANTSRGVVAPARRRYRRVVVVEVTAPPAVLAARLAGRGRESEADIAQRLARSVSAPISGAVTIDNSGVVTVAGERFIAVLRGLAEPAEAR